MEVWRAVVGWEGEYEVSDQGRVRSLDRIVICEWAKQGARREKTFSRRHPGRIIAPDANTSGHLAVRLNGKAKRYVHRLMLEAFVGPCPPGEEALHRDDVPDHNRLPNLYWGTRRQNLLDAVRNGKKPVGDDLSFSKLKARDIPTIRLRLLNESPAEIARSYGVQRQCIVKVRDGINWKHVT